MLFPRRILTLQHSEVKARFYDRSIPHAIDFPRANRMLCDLLMMLQTSKTLAVEEIGLNNTLWVNVYYRHTNKA